MFQKEREKQQNKNNKNPIVGCRNLCSVEREEKKLMFSIHSKPVAKCKHKHENKMKPSERPPQLLVPTYLNYTYHLLAYILNVLRTLKRTQLFTTAAEEEKKKTEK